MHLTADDAGAILRRAGARRVAVAWKTYGKLVGLLVYFEHRGACQVWRIRSDAHTRNFERDVERELGRAQQRAA